MKLYIFSKKISPHQGQQQSSLRKEETTTGVSNLFQDERYLKKIKQVASLLLLHVFLFCFLQCILAHQEWETEYVFTCVIDKCVCSHRSREERPAWSGTSPHMTCLYFFDSVHARLGNFNFSRQLAYISLLKCDWLISAGVRWGGGGVRQIQCCRKQI